MSTIVKICGLNDRVSVETAVAAGADYLGFIIFPRSPRALSPTEAGALAAHKGAARSVAVLVDPDDALLGEVLARMAPDIIQLHGDESPARCLDARAYAGEGVWKALGVSAADDLERATRWRGCVDGFVFDAKPPADASRPGGLGVGWDYSLLSGFDPGAPWLLAGGLSVDNVADAIAQSGARGVDVVSGVEARPGVKDADKIRAFIAAARKPRPLAC
ncbi:phosphoribosylanthranilate isomerase [Alkalicaulis satelles]|uniref:N-(5'-phosphoribosyl)anthranilate isomerase n=1 Tax=Alkalicaulis satelles TaxID=2609175 RepID=A0A5M6ZHX3_9PROT|nr:phosphoribosylanthranilate isomerase [Alkalicaulis satelles]KAA5803404.1 phosphoribosylanthranilate isomerase [Alkalicaulis satelles]